MPVWLVKATWIEDEAEASEQWEVDAARADEAVKEVTGYVVGSIPPFSWQPEGFRTFLDISLMNEPLLGVGTGVWGYEILITPENLVKASGAILVNLVDREKNDYSST